MLKAYLALDPGRGKFGFVLVREQVVRDRGILPCPELGAWLKRILAQQNDLEMILGDGTGAGEFRRVIDGLFQGVVHLVDEKNSTLEARDLFFAAYPPRGFWALLPRTLVPISEPLDDFAAEVLYRRFVGDR